MNLAQKVADTVRPKYKGHEELWFHGLPHVESVADTAERLARAVNVAKLREVVSPVVARSAAYCHDLGRIVETAGPELGNTDHAALGITETVNVLKKAGASDGEIGAIVGAIAVHSDKAYTGKSEVAKVLRDADKYDALGPWGTLRCARHWCGAELVGTGKVMAAVGSQSAIESLAQETVDCIRGNESQKADYLRNLNFVLEWIEREMLDTPQAYEMLDPGYQYTRKERIALVSDELARTVEASRIAPTRRKLYAFNADDDPGLHFLINAIQPDSMVRPHARSRDEIIMHMTGALGYVQFNYAGEVTQAEVLDDARPSRIIPANTFFTVTSLEEDSVMGALIQGPHDETDFRTDPAWAPEGTEQNREYYDGLKAHFN